MGAQIGDARVGVNSTVMIGETRINEGLPQPVHDFRTTAVAKCNGINPPEIAAATPRDDGPPHDSDAPIGGFEAGPERRKRRVPWRKIATALLVLVALALAWKYTPLSDWVSVANATEWASQYADYWWAPLLLILLYTPASVVMFPRPILTLTAVFVFGAWPGIGYAMAGVLLAVTVHYYAGRQFQRDTVRRFAGDRLNRITDFSHRRTP